MLRYFLRKSLIVVLLLLIFNVSLVSAEEIQLREFHPDIQIPDTDIKAGILIVNQDGFTVGKVGFRINNDLYYLEKVQPEKFNELDVFGDNQYAIFRNFLIIGTWGSPTGHGRWLFLFKFGKDNIKFVDALHAAKYDFAEMYDTPDKKTHTNKKLNILRGKNNNGNIIRITIFEAYFSPFVEVNSAGFKINLSPTLYESLFNKIKNKPQTKKAEINEYLIYGFLSKKLDKEEISAYLARKRKDPKDIIMIIDNLNELNVALHPKEQIILKKIKKEGGK